VNKRGRKVGDLMRANTSIRSERMTCSRRVGCTQRSIYIYLCIYEAIVTHCQAGGEVAEFCARLLPAAFRQVEGGGEGVVALGDGGGCLQ
jgi:hypothetical protein